MSIKVDFGGVIATINRGKWSTNKAGKLSLDKTKDRDGLLEKALNSFLGGTWPKGSMALSQGGMSTMRVLLRCLAGSVGRLLTSRSIRARPQRRPVQ